MDGGIKVLLSSAREPIKNSSTNFWVGLVPWLGLCKASAFHGEGNIHGEVRGEVVGSRDLWGEPEDSSQCGLVAMMVSNQRLDLMILEVCSHLNNNIPFSASVISCPGLG